MVTKTRLAIAAALLLAASSAAQAANDTPQAQKAGGKGANAAAHTQASAPPKADPKTDVKYPTSDGKCWMNTSNGNYGWSDCPKPTSNKH